MLFCSFVLFLVASEMDENDSLLSTLQCLEILFKPPLTCVNGDTIHSIEFSSGMCH
jgi:hypothetical protein